MKFNINGFTHKGTGIYRMNEDRLLINGKLLDEGELYLPDQDNCICFVSDGVGGNRGGHYAATYVLLSLRNLKENEYSGIVDNLYHTNKELIESTKNEVSLKNCACTLSGIIATESFTDFYHVGDSEIWLLRNDMLMKITKDEVLDSDDPGSPLTNYFGGDENKLKINTEWVKPEILTGDIFLICSDGLFKSLNVKIVKPILVSDKNGEEKIQKLKENCLTLGSEDNVSVVLIELV
jgi:protein phosphatase